MPDDNDQTPDVTPDAPRSAGWRTADIPGWSLLLGLVLLAIVALALASAGGTAGIVAVAAVQGAVVYLLYLWCSAGVPPRSAGDA